MFAKNVQKKQSNPEMNMTESLALEFASSAILEGTSVEQNQITISMCYRLICVVRSARLTCWTNMLYEDAFDATTASSS